MTAISQKKTSAGGSSSIVTTAKAATYRRSEEHTSELQSRFDLVRLPSSPPRRSSDLFVARNGRFARRKAGQPRYVAAFAVVTIEEEPPAEVFFGLTDDGHLPEEDLGWWLFLDRHHSEGCDVPQIGRAHV